MDLAVGEQFSLVFVPPTRGSPQQMLSVDVHEVFPKLRLFPDLETFDFADVLDLLLRNSELKTNAIKTPHVDEKEDDLDNAKSITDDIAQDGQRSAVAVPQIAKFDNEEKAGRSKLDFHAEHMALTVHLVEDAMTHDVSQSVEDVQNAVAEIDAYVGDTAENEERGESVNLPNSLNDKRIIVEHQRFSLDDVNVPVLSEHQISKSNVSNAKAMVDIAALQVGLRQKLVRAAAVLGGASEHSQGSALPKEHIPDLVKLKDELQNVSAKASIGGIMTKTLFFERKGPEKFVHQKAAGTRQISSEAHNEIYKSMSSIKALENGISYRHMGVTADVLLGVAGRSLPDDGIPIQKQNDTYIVSPMGFHDFPRVESPKASVKVYLEHPIAPKVSHRHGVSDSTLRVPTFKLKNTRPSGESAMLEVDSSDRLTSAMTFTHEVSFAPASFDGKSVSANSHDRNSIISTATKKVLTHEENSERVLMPILEKMPVKSERGMPPLSVVPHASEEDRNIRHVWIVFPRMEKLEASALNISSNDSWKISQSHPKLITHVVRWASSQVKRVPAHAEIEVEGVGLLKMSLEYDEDLGGLRLEVKISPSTASEHIWNHLDLKNAEESIREGVSRLGVFSVTLKMEGEVRVTPQRTLHLSAPTGFKLDDFTSFTDRGSNGRSSYQMMREMVNLLAQLKKSKGRS